MSVLTVENSLIPSYILTGDSKYTDIDITPHADKETGHFTVFVQIADGIFVYRGFKDIFTSFSKTEKIKTLTGLSRSGMTDKIAGFIFSDKSKLKMPFEAVRLAQKFFLDIYNKYKTESATVWYYNPITFDWKCVFPIQVNMSHGGITYVLTGQGDNRHSKRATEIAEEKPEYRKALDDVEQEVADLIANGYYMFGTIHSHCDFSAFHSGVDDADEYGFDGIHITIGNVDKEPSYSQRLMGNQADIALSDITDIVNMGDKTIADLRNMSDLPDTLETYGDRCFVSEKKNYTSGTSYVYRNGAWVPKDEAKDVTPFGIPLSAYDRWKENEIDDYNDWWEKKEQQTFYPSNDTLDDEFAKNQKVKFTLHGVVALGKIVGECEVSEQDLKRSKWRPGKLYWIKSRSFPAKVLVDAWDIDPINKKG